MRQLILLGLLAAALLLAVSVTPVAAEERPDGEKIFFAHSERGPVAYPTDIYAINADGTGLEQITDSPKDFGRPTAPSLEPGNGQIAKVAFEEKVGAGPDGIWVKDLAGGDPERIADGTAPTFSPDGSRIAYRGEGGLPIKNAIGTNVYIMDVDGSSKKLLTEPNFENDGDICPFPESGGTPESSGILSRAVFSADGSRLAYVAQRDVDPLVSDDPPDDDTHCDNSINFYVMDVNGNAETRVSQLPIVDDFQLLPLSFDWWSRGSSGGKFAFSAQNRGESGWSLYEIPYGGNQPSRILRPSDNDFFSVPAYSPDGSQIAYRHLFISDPEARSTVKVLDGGSSSELAAGGSPAWTPAPDTDGDGLFDIWEEKGVDFDADGSLDGEDDVDLPAMGADPEYKDIFVEADAMRGHRLAPEAIKKVYDAFRAAPVDNPNGQRGILLHVDNGQGSTMNPRNLRTWLEHSRFDLLPHYRYLGRGSGHTYDWHQFDKLKEDHFSEGRERIFHYAIMGHFVEKGSARSRRIRGRSRGIPGSDFQVSFGFYCDNAGHRCKAPEHFPAPARDLKLTQGAVFMHELGHNLGLKHGGPDHIGAKPNYPSIMNYLYSNYSGLVRRTRGGKKAGILDYSRVGLTIDERSLNERAGFTGASGTWAEGILTVTHCPGGVRKRRILRTGPTDFNCDDDPGGGVIPPVNLNGDKVNGREVLGVLQGQNDWDNLTFDGGAVGSLDVAPDLPTTTTIPEPPIGKLMGLARALETGSSGSGGASGRRVPSGRAPGGRAAGAALAYPRVAVTRIRCRSAQPCRGVVKLVARVIVKRVVGRGSQRRVIRRARPAVIGATRLRLPAGRTAVQRIRFNRRGHRVLRRARRGGRRAMPALLAGPAVKNRVIRLRIPSRR